MKFRLKFRESTLEKARIFLTNTQRRLDFIHRGNWPAQFLCNAHCGFTEKIYCSAKTSHSSGAINFRRPSKPDYKHQNFGLLEFWNVLFILSFYAAKNFLPLYALESGISILWVGFFYNARIDSSHVFSV